MLVDETLEQGRSSTKIVGEWGGSRSLQNIGHHSWPTEKVLSFEWPKTAQMTFKFLCFFRIIFEHV